MSRDVASMGKDALRDEVVRLRAVLATCHDQMHKGEVDKAHETLHCLATGENPATGNITLTDAARLADFMHRFNELCVGCGVPAATVVLVASATAPGYVSIQLGGHVPTIQHLRRMMGMKPTVAAGPVINEATR